MQLSRTNSLVELFFKKYAEINSVPDKPFLKWLKENEKEFLTWKEAALKIEILSDEVFEKAFNIKNVKTPEILKSKNKYFLVEIESIKEKLLLYNDPKVLELLNAQLSFQNKIESNRSILKDISVGGFDSKKIKEFADKNNLSLKDYVVSDLKQNEIFSEGIIKRIFLTQDGKVGTTDCPVQLVSTSTPVCSTVLYTPASSEWRTSRSDLVTGGNVVELASYNSGVSQTKWEVGFDSSYNPIVVMASATGITGWNHSGKFINDELTTEPLQITGLTGSPVSPAGITRSNLESGWKYMGTITDPNSQLYYVYAAVDTNNKSIKQVVFACNCSGIYLDTTQPVYYSRTSATTDITLNVIGYTAGSEEHTWAITTQPAHGTLAYKAGSPTNSSATYVYTQNGDFMTSDSFVITLSNACGTTIGTKYVQILPSQRIRYTSTDVIVFFDT